jgi:ubiquitin-protein ligase
MSSTTTTATLATTITDQDIYTYQLQKMLEKMGVSESDDSVIETIESISPLLTNYCIGCQTLLEYPSTEYKTCGKQECIYILEEFFLDDYIVDYMKIKQQADIAELLLDIAFQTMRSGRREKIFEPFPKFLFKSDTISAIKRGNLTALSKDKTDLVQINNSKDFAKLDAMLEQYSVKNLMKICMTKTKDSEIIAEIGADWYRLIKFILKSNQTDMMPTEVVSFKSASTPVAAKEPPTIYQFKINHQIDVEDRFKKESKSFGTIFLYHGSATENWFSIMRNGLKITSGTSLMTTGAAYGNGIYLSSDINVSLGYAQGTTMRIFGVYEVINDKSKYTHSHTIFVAKSEEMLLLRYLFVIPTRSGSLDLSNFTDTLNKMFNIGIHNNIKSITSTIDTIKNKRLLTEYKKMHELEKKGVGISVEIPDESNFYLWKVYITNFEGSKIESDMKKLGIKAIEMEIIFTEKYPINPPFIRIIYPRFQFRTGHITSGGSICMELLTNKGWSSVCSLESIIYDIKANIIEGDGQIDIERYHIRYSFEEAREAFNRMVKSHGW